MSIIKIDCIDQTLNMVNAPLIASGDVETDIVKFEFCPLWNGFLKTAVFYRASQRSIQSYWMRTARLQYPKKSFKKKGFSISVYMVSLRARSKPLRS